MEAIQRIATVLLDEFCRRTGFDGDRCKAWFADKKRRRLTYAASMFALSLLILLIYACSQRPDV